MTWDEYFRILSKVVASMSKCHSRLLGAILVKDKLVVSTGFNGPPKGIQHCHVGGEPLCPRRELGYGTGEGVHLCPAAHAERNAIDLAARLGHSTDGTTMYCNCPIPCLDCAKSIIQAGVKEVVVTEMLVYEQEGWTGLEMLNQGGVIVREYANT